jgi:hypothetical protein
VAIIHFLYRIKGRAPCRFSSSPESEARNATPAAFVCDPEQRQRTLMRRNCFPGLGINKDNPKLRTFIRLTFNQILIPPRHAPSRQSRTRAIKPALSEERSIKICFFAPSSAAFASSIRYLFFRLHQFRRSDILPPPASDQPTKHLTSGSRPASFAICALKVRRFFVCTKQMLKSSSRHLPRSAQSPCTRNSGVRFSLLFNVSKVAVRRSSSSRKWRSRSSKVNRSWYHVKPPWPLCDSAK